METDHSIWTIIALMVGVSAAVLTLIFIGSLGGTTYNLVEPDLNAIGSTESAVNESFTAINGTAVQLTYGDWLSTPVIINSSNVTISSGNWTFDTSAGTITLKINATGNNSVYKATYDYRNHTIQDNIKDSVVSSFDALEQTGKYLPLIVLAIIIVLIMGMVLGLGVMQRKDGGSGGAL